MRKNLALDEPLYEFLSDAPRKGWNQVRPEGTVDAKLTYTGRIEDPAATQPGETAPTSPSFEAGRSAAQAFDHADGGSVSAG